MTTDTELPNDGTQTLILSDDYLFSTIEGEGETIGQPSIFLRLSKCNLTCKSFASADSPNGCDSFISWSVSNKMTFEAIWEEYFVKQGFADKLAHGVALLKLTGGEPLLQGRSLLKFIDYIKSKDSRLSGDGDLRIDFETNATIRPDDSWVKDHAATFTTSPKLTTNGDPESKTYKPDVLRYHSEIGSCFKFVITCSEDIDEIWRKYVDDDNGINVDKHRIWLMPACGSRAEHIERAPAVAEYAKALGVNFSPRLHLLLWDKALKV